MIRWDFNGKMGLCMKHLRGRRSEMKEKKSSMGQEKAGYSHLQHAARLMVTCSVGISCLQNKI